MSRATPLDELGQQFEIDGVLLAEDTSGWRNLGLWGHDTHRQQSALCGLAPDLLVPDLLVPDLVDCNLVEGRSYAQAAEALAVRVGETALLTEHTQLLELACGQGASLWLWQRKFNVTQISAIEIQNANVQLLRQRSSASWTIAHGRFDVLPLPVSIEPGRYDAVVCVDAAYHACSLSAFLQVARAALVEGGRLSFTTLAVNPAYGELPKLLSLMLTKADIPKASLQTPQDIEESMINAGFANVKIELLDDNVFAGFAQYIRGRAGHLTWRQKISRAWFKIKATALLCNSLAETPRLHYVLISGAAATPQSPAKF